MTSDWDSLDRQEKIILLVRHTHESISASYEEIKRAAQKKGYFEMNRWQIDRARRLQVAASND